MVVLGATVVEGSVVVTSDAAGLVDGTVVTGPAWSSMPPHAVTSAAVMRTVAAN